MSWIEAINVPMRIIFIVIALATFVDYIKNRGRNRLDIHLMFLSITFLLTVQLIQQVTGLEFPIWRKFGLMAFLAQPFLLLRLTTYYRSVPVSERTKSIVWGVSVAGLTCSWLIYAFSPGSIPIAFSLVVIFYIVFVEGYVSWFFIRGALKTVGVTKQRLRFVASGTACLAMVFVLLGVSLVIPLTTIKDLISVLVPVVIVMAALSYYIGFLPPNILRKSWQLTEFFNFQQEMDIQTSGVKGAQSLQELCNVAVRVTGGSAALAFVPTDDALVFRIETTAGSGAFPETVSVVGGIFEEARIHHRSVLFTTNKGLSQTEQDLASKNDAEAIMAVPIQSGGHIHAVVIVLLLKKPLFPHDDQRLLTLLAGQVAIRLAYDASLAEQEHLVMRLQLTNQELKRSTQMKSEFLANMSHELRTPMNAIIGFSEFMHDERLGPLSEDYKELLGNILTSSRHLLQLINDVLDLAKVEAGKMEFYPALVNISSLVNEVRDIVRGLFVNKRIKMEMEIDGGIGEVLIDPAKLKQVLYNYLSNAIKFTPSGGSVTLRARVVNDAFFQIEVADTGIGIDPNSMHLLFQEFQQLDSSPSKEYQGTGLGLALTKRIVEAQGGRVGVESKPGEGSTFTALLPRCHQTALNPESVELLVAASHTSEFSALRMLVIEDDESDRKWLVNTLGQYGYDIQTTWLGADALAKCREQVYDAITLDLLLPDMSGIEVLRGIRSESLNMRTPVIVISVVEEEGVVEGLPVHGFLTKPVQPNELFNELTKAGITPNDKESVLVVEDDLNSRKVITANLTQLGYNAIFAENGETGLKVIEEHRPAAVVLDLMMPGMDGFEFLSRLRNLSESSQVNVVVWTAKELSKEDHAILDVMAQAVVLKRHGRIEDLLKVIEVQVANSKEKRL